MENIINNRHLVLVRQAFQQAAVFLLGDQQASRGKWKKRIGQAAMNKADSNIKFWNRFLYWPIVCSEK
jgi:hypothetical protein